MCTENAIEKEKYGNTAEASSNLNCVASVKDGDARMHAHVDKDADKVHSVRESYTDTYTMQR